MKHQITTANVLHNEVNTSLGLETSMQIRQERMSFPVRHQEHALFGSYALNFVVFDNEFLLENLDRVKPPRPLRLR